MVATENDLWPKDINGLPALRTPVSILREQASLLGDKTDHLVEADVVARPSQNNRFAHSFQLIAPALNQYRYSLFEVTHGIELYPLSISFNNTGYQVNKEPEFLEKLKMIFAHDQTKKVIQALVAQSRI